MGGFEGDGRRDGCGGAGAIFRNEPNFWVWPLDGTGWRGFRRGGGRLGAGGLDGAEVVEGAVVGALEDVAAALEADEGGLAIVEGVAEDLVVGHRLAEVGFFAALDVGEFPFPEVGFDAAEAAEGPLAIDQDVEEGALFGGLGVEVVEVLFGEGLEGGGVLAANDLRLGVDAGLQGILRGDGFALGGARAGGFASVGAIGGDLLFGGHKRKRRTGEGPPDSRVAGGIRDSELNTLIINGGTL